MSSRRPAAGGAGGQEKHKETYDEWLARVERKKKTKKFMEKRGEKEEATRKEHSKGESGAAYQVSCPHAMHPHRAQGQCVPSTSFLREIQ